MKKIVKLMFLAGALTLFGVTETKAQIVIHARLNAPVVKVRPERPSPRHVWIGEEWTPNGSTYAYKGGYWAEPPHRGARWVAGQWRDTHHGWVWKQGHWK
jgi:hypothetical protein